MLLLIREYIAVYFLLSSPSYPRSDLICILHIYFHRFKTDMPFFFSRFMKFSLTTASWAHVTYCGYTACYRDNSAWLCAGQRTALLGFVWGRGQLCLALRGAEDSFAWLCVGQRTALPGSARGRGQLCLALRGAEGSSAWLGVGQRELCLALRGAEDSSAWLCVGQRTALLGSAWGRGQLCLALRGAEDSSAWLYVEQRAALPGSAWVRGSSAWLCVGQRTALLGSAWGRRQLCLALRGAEDSSAWLCVGQRTALLGSAWGRGQLCLALRGAVWTALLGSAWGRGQLCLALRGAEDSSAWLYVGQRELCLARRAVRGAVWTSLFLLAHSGLVGTGRGTEVKSVIPAGLDWGQTGVFRGRLRGCGQHNSWSATLRQMRRYGAGSAMSQATCNMKCVKSKV